MKELIMYLAILVIIYLFYIVFVHKRKNVYKKFLEGKEVKYLNKVYNVKIDDTNKTKISHCIYIVNSIILSTTVFVVSLFNNIVLEILLGFVTLLVLIFVLYHILGKIFGKRK